MYAIDMRYFYDLHTASIVLMTTVFVMCVTIVDMHKVRRKEVNVVVVSASNTTITITNNLKILISPIFCLIQLLCLAWLGYGDISTYFNKISYVDKSVDGSKVCLVHQFVVCCLQLSKLTK